MKNYKKFIYLLPIVLTALFCLVAFNNIQQQEGYILEHEKDIQKAEPGPHNGGGKTTAFPFFSKDPEVKLAFRKRILHPGSSIGYHLQEQQEVYYILSGKGILTMNGKEIRMNTGDALLTKAGSSHGLKPAGNEDLVVLITYEN